MSSASKWATRIAQCLSEKEFMEFANYVSGFDDVDFRSEVLANRDRRAEIDRQLRETANQSLPLLTPVRDLGEEPWRDGGKQRCSSTECREKDWHGKIDKHGRLIDK